MDNVLKFPIIKENTERLQKLKNAVLIDFESNKITGFNSNHLYPLLAYGDRPVIDLEGSFIFFEPNFPEKIKKLSLKREFLQIYKKFKKDLNSLSVSQKGISFHLIFEDFDLEDLCDFYSIKPSICFNKEMTSIEMSKDEFKKILNQIFSIQNKAEELIDEFILTVEKKFYSKKLKLNKFHNLQLDLRTA